MRKITTYIGVLLAALVVASGAGAASLEAHCYHQTARGELACAKRALYGNRGAVRWIKHHVSDQPQHSLGYYKWRERIDLRLIREAERRLQPVFPPHHALWLCIYHHEASTAPGGWYNRDTGHNYHYGGLQMHYNWGYGIRGYAYNYSQLQQEWAAERGYRANGYSHIWLMGQWAHYDCLPYA